MFNLQEKKINQSVIEESISFVKKIQKKAKAKAEAEAEAKPMPAPNKAEIPNLPPKSQTDSRIYKKKNTPKDKGNENSRLVRKSELEGKDNKFDVIQRLVRVADSLDRQGYRETSDKIDNILRKIL